MRIHEEVAEARIAEVLLDAPANSGAGSGGPGLPRAAWAIGALRKPAAGGGAAEQPPVLGRSDGELKPDALVAGKERQEAVSRGGADDLQAAGRFERAE